MEVVEKKKPNTSYAYASSIEKISRHYSLETGRNVDIYKEKDIGLIEDIAQNYGKSGKFFQFGNKGNGTIRCAIATYVRFLKSNSSDGEFLCGHFSIDQKDSKGQDHYDHKTTLTNCNFSYENDLKISLFNQADQIFPGYSIYKNDKEDVEFLVEDKKIDLLLENNSDKSFLIVKLKFGEADFRDFGQVATHIGLLSKKFPNRTIKGTIIARKIHETLQNACLVTEIISLKTYQIQLTLIDK